MEPSSCNSASQSDSTALNSSAEQTSLAAAFYDAASCRRDYPAVLMGECAFSYDAIDRAAQKVAHFLRQQRCVDAQSRVGLMLGNSPEYVAAFYGTLLAGCIAVPLPPDIEPRRLASIATACQMDVLLSTRDNLRRRRVDSLRSETVDLGRDSGRPLFRMEPPACDPQRPCVILFTSGTSGEPKGVTLSEANLLANARAIGQYLPIRSDDRALAMLPFYHAFGNSILQTHLLRGATLVIAGNVICPNSIVEAIREFDVTTFSGVPESYAAMLAWSELGTLPMPSLRYMTVAGGSLRPELAISVAERIAPADFYVMYGQTEATARLACLPPRELRARAGSIGKAIPGVELRVSDDSGHPVPPGHAGMLCARGPNVMLGYWLDPQATARTIKDGWLQTGDIATIDRDGYIFVQGRKSDLVKIQGFRTHPREVEDVVLHYFPQSQVVVVACELQGATRFALFLIASECQPLTDVEIRQQCLRELPRSKVPAYIEFLPRWPLNGAGKIDRVALKCRAEKIGNQIAFQQPRRAAARKVA